MARTPDYLREGAYQELRRRGLHIAFETAATWVEVLHRQSTIDLAEFFRHLDAYAEEGLAEALADADEAWNAGLEVVASVTFEASMQLAGIRAAKAALGIQD